MMGKIKVATLRYFCSLPTCPWVCQQAFPKIRNIKYFRKPVLRSLFFLPVNSKKIIPKRKTVLKHSHLNMHWSFSDWVLNIRIYWVSLFLLRRQAITPIISHKQHIFFWDLKCYPSCRLKFNFLLFPLNSPQVI